eukprot:scaffold166975_cov33-Tisochrysis_lutea.AAC.2
MEPRNVHADACMFCSSSRSALYLVDLDGRRLHGFLLRGKHRLASRAKALVRAHRREEPNLGLGERLVGSRVFWARHASHEAWWWRSRLTRVSGGSPTVCDILTHPLLCLRSVAHSCLAAPRRLLALLIGFVEELTILLTLSSDVLTRVVAIVERRQRDRRPPVGLDHRTVGALAGRVTRPALGLPVEREPIHLPVVFMALLHDLKLFGHAFLRLLLRGRGSGALSG